MLIKMEGNYLNVLPKDLLTLVADYQGPNIFVSKDNAEEITFLFVTPLLDFSRTVRLDSMNKENVATFIAVIKGQRLNSSRLLSLDMKDREGQSNNFYFDRYDEVSNQKAIYIIGDGFHLKFITPSLLIDKFFKALADLFDIPYKLEKSQFIGDKVVAFFPSNKAEMKLNSSIVAKIYTQLLFVDFNISAYKDVDKLKLFIRTVEEDSSQTAKIEGFNDRVMIWKNHQLMLRADRSEFIIFKGKLVTTVLKF